MKTYLEMASLMIDLPDFKKKPVAVQLKMKCKRRLAEASRSIYKGKFETEKNKVELLPRQLEAAQNQIKQQKTKMEEMKVQNAKSQQKIMHINQLNHFYRTLTTPYNPTSDFELLSMHTPPLVATPDSIEGHVMVCSLSPKWSQINEMVQTRRYY